MISIRESSFYANMAKEDVRTCLKLISSQYKLLDEALFKIAHNEDILADNWTHEASLLKNKELLLMYASEISCKNLHDLSEKITFFEKVLHTEKIEADSLPEDILMRSILKDIQYQTNLA